jgi:hypothetical protein
MENQKHSTLTTFFSSNLNQVELEQILQRIDENLALRPILRHQDTDPAGASTASPPSLPDLGEFAMLLQRLRMMRAPLFVVKGSDPRNQLKRLLNLPIRVFGRRQTRFNNELLDALTALLTDMQGIYEHAEYQLQRARVAEQLQDHTQRLEAIADTLREQQHDQAGRLAQLEATCSRLVEDRITLSDRLDQLAADQQGQYKWLEKLAADQQGQHKWLEQLTADQQGQHKWLEQVTASLRGQEDWTQLLQRKYDRLALDVRERIVSQFTTTGDLPEPRVLDPNAYRERLAGMNDRIRVNLGCGEKPLPDYINVDLRELTDVDVVADARRLPFDPGTLAELSSAHLVEHFREHQLRTRVLPYWKSLLRPDGTLRIICPNWGAMLERLNDGRMSLTDFKLLTFGAQDYEGDDHFAMYTPETLSSLLNDCGFARVEVVVTDRMNGLCPEMELRGYP